MKSFVTSRGVEIEFIGVPPRLLEKLQAQHPMPEPPFYEVKAATGTIEKHPHDETTLDVPNDPEATATNHAAWAAYRQELEKAEADFNVASMRLVMLRGISFHYPEDESWVKDQEYIGVKVPSDPTERRMHWLETEALGTKADYEKMLEGVSRASGMPEEAIAEAAANFRGQVVGQGAGGPATPSNGKDLDHEQPVRAGARRHKVGHSEDK